jgi:hypothetical protein
MILGLELVKIQTKYNFTIYYLQNELLIIDTFGLVLTNDGEPVKLTR